VTRRNTGPQQTDSGWPGVFIRGDEAMNYASVLAQLPKFGLPKKFVAPGSAIGGLIAALNSCRKDAA